MYIILGYRLLQVHISLSRLYFEMISDVITAYTHCGDVQPKPSSTVAYQEEN